jgi:hypothetical protein
MIGGGIDSQDNNMQNQENNSDFDEVDFKICGELGRFKD